MKAFCLTGCALLLLLSCRLAGGEGALFRTRDCRLTANGAPAAAIVTPEAFRDLAAQIAAAVRARTGKNLPILSDADPLTLLKTPRNFIVLGGRDDNRFTSELYDRHFIILDADYPGPGGWLVRSAPHPGSAAHALVFAGGSGREAAENAVRHLVQVLRSAPENGGDLTLPWLWELHPGGNFHAVPVEQAYDAPLVTEINGYYGNQGYFGWNVISRLLALFYFTGDTAYAREFVRLAFPDAEALRYLKRPEIIGESIELKDRPLSGSYHYQAHWMIVYWNMVCDHPFFTPELRAKIDREFMRQHEYLGRKEANLAVTGIRRPLPLVPDRHMCYSALTLYTLCRYFALYDPEDPRWREGLRSAEHVFGSFRQNFAVAGEKGNHYWLATGLQPLMDYLRLSGMRHRVPRRYLEELTTQMEVLASGRERDVLLAFASPTFFNELYHLNGKPSALVMRRLTYPDADPVFRLGQSFRPPADAADGAQLPRGVWQRAALDIRGSGIKPDFADPERVFPLISRRDGDGDYLLVDGRDEQNRAPLHTLTLLRLSLGGTTVLAGNRNQLYAGCDGLRSPENPRCAELLCAEGAGESAFFRAKVGNVNFTDWTRSILKRAGRYALVFDTVRPRRDARAMQFDFCWELPAEMRFVRSGPGGAAFAAAPDRAGSRIAKKSLTFAPETGLQRRRAQRPDTLQVRSGDALRVRFTLDKPFRGWLLPELLRHANAAPVLLALDGKPCGGPFDRQSQEFAAEPVWVGPVELAAGTHELVQTARGAGLAGFRDLRFLPEETVRDWRADFSDAVTPKSRRGIDDFLYGGSGRLLEFRLSVPAEKGREQHYFTLFVPGGKRACARIADNAAALRLPENAVAATGNFDGIAATAAVLGETHFAGTGVTAVRSLLKADRPVTADWDFASGRLTVLCDAETRLTLPGNVGRTLPPGGHCLTMRPPPEILRELRADLEKKCAVLDRPVNPAPDLAPALPKAKLRPAWRFAVPEFPTALVPFDRGGTPALLTAVGPRVLVLSAATGRILREWKEESDVTALFAVPETGTLLVGRRDHLVRAYDENGNRRWEFASQMDPGVAATGKAYWYRTYPGLGGIRGLSAMPFRDGKMQYFVGTASTVEILNGDGSLDRRLRQWWGPCCQFTPIRNARGAVMLVGRRHNGYHHLGILEAAAPRFPHYGYWDLADPKHRVIGWIGVVRNCILFTDLAGDEKPVVVSDLTGIDNRIAIWDADGKPLCDVPVFGPQDPPRRAVDKPASFPMPMRGLAAASLTGGKRKHLYCVTGDSLLLEFDPALKPVRCTVLPVEPLALTAFPGVGRLMIAGVGGKLLLTDAHGAPLACGEVAGTPLHACAAGNLAVTATDREIAAHRLEISEEK